MRCVYTNTLTLSSLWEFVTLQGKGKKLEVAQVIAPYDATSSNQLSLLRGQLVSIRKKTASGWWEGELHVRVCSIRL